MPMSDAIDQNPYDTSPFHSARRPYFVSSGRGENVSTAGGVAASALENNYLTVQQVAQLEQDFLACVEQDYQSCWDAVEARYAALSEANRAEMLACTTVSCWEYHRDRINAAQVLIG